MAKTSKFTIETCGSKFVLRSSAKPQHYLCLDGRMSPFKDDGALILNDERTADIVAQALNKDNKAFIISMVIKAMQDIEFETPQAPAYKSLLSAAGIKL